ncbi:MAG TPA: ABC transporter ATP-binding protein [Pirellulales bacterium]|nr:ABC transporter ATP-binding protein [Pirellulales bacterium]
MDFKSDSWKALPPVWQASLSAQLAGDESLLGWFETDLDSQLHYAPGLVALTNKRMLAYCPQKQALAVTPAAASPSKLNGHLSQWQSWPLAADLKLHAIDQAAVGTLELCDATSRLASWRYTAARSAFARRLESQCAAIQSQRGKLSTEVVVLPTVCPSCGAIITSSDGICAACAPVAPPAPVSSLFRLFAFAKPRALMVVLGLLLTFAGTAASLVPLYLTMPLINNVLVPRFNGQAVSVQLACWYLVGLFGSAVLAWLLNWGRLYVTSWVSERIASDLRTRTYAHLQCLSLEFFGGKRTGDLMSRISNDTDRICVFLSVSLVDFISDSVMIVMAAAVLIYTSPMLALCTLVTFPIIVWLVYGVRRRLRHGFDQSTVATAHLNNVLADTIPGIRVVKAFAQEQREIERFDRANAHLVSINDGVNIVWSFFGPIISFLTELGLLAVWAFSVWLIFHDQITLGVISLFTGAIGRFYARLESMLRIVYTTQRAAASSHRIFEILDRVPSVPEPVNPVHPARLQGRIELRGVRFKYGTREVLHGINLQIEPGEMIGLVGPTGAGKSTLINLICRFFDVAEGAILVDGVDIRSYPVAEYRKHIGLVLQDPFLFYGTIAENIAYGRPNASQAEIVAAARAARAHEFILQLPDGYDSLVGERGQSLSGGERQRISIARAILIDPRILILDEATSSVDTETEREIQIALDNLIRGRTTIAIAHRLSTLRKADRLVVVERGRIAEIGKHAELLREEGAYARLHKAQMELVQGIGV